MLAPAEGLGKSEVSKEYFLARRGRLTLHFSAAAD